MKEGKVTCGSTECKLGMLFFTDSYAPTGNFQNNIDTGAVRLNLVATYRPLNYLISHNLIRIIYVANYIIKEVLGALASTGSKVIIGVCN